MRVIIQSDDGAVEAVLAPEEVDMVKDAVSDYLEAMEDAGDANGVQVGVALLDKLRS